MGKGRRFQKKCRTRHKKSGVERNRRIKVHGKKLIALGMTQEQVKHMTSKSLRETLNKMVKAKAKAKSK